MSDDVGFVAASDGDPITPNIAHECEKMTAPDGSFLQVYNYLEYRFRDLPDAAEARARVYYGERSASLYLNIEESPKSAELIVDYFKRRLFTEVTRLGSGGYEPLWRQEENGA